MGFIKILAQTVSEKSLFLKPHFVCPSLLNPKSINNKKNKNENYTIAI